MQVDIIIILLLIFYVQRTRNKGNIGSLVLRVIGWFLVYLVVKQLILSILFFSPFGMLHRVFNMLLMWIGACVLVVVGWYILLKKWR